MGSDDMLAVWLNGTRILADSEMHGCEPEMFQLKLQLKPGKNTLLLKVGQGTGQWCVVFTPKVGASGVPPAQALAAALAAPPPAAVAPKAGTAAPKPLPSFEDVSDAVGLGARGIGSRLRGNCLAVADVNGDGRPDFLYGAGTGLLVLNTGSGFAEARNHGISFEAGKVVPVFGDFDGDKSPDLFVPQDGKCKLYRNDGRGHFSDVMAKSGALAQPIPGAVCAAWADFNNRGRLDLLVGCLRGPNRYFRNNGNGTFADGGDEIGLYRRIFNTRALAVCDINKDGVPDLVLNNEGQEPAALLGSVARTAAGGPRSK